MKLDELKGMKIWMPWIDGITGKKPSLDGIRYAKWSDNSLFMNYDEAIRLAESKPGLKGLGFKIPAEIRVIDLDKCYAESGDLNSVARRLVYQFLSYAEKSPSGRGLHIIVKADLEGYSKKTVYIQGQKVEILTPGNFVTFTGNNINHKVNWINDGTTIIQNIYDFNGIKKKIIPQGPTREENEYVTFGHSHNCAYGKMALSRECDEVSGACEGERNNKLNNAAVKIGNLVAGGCIDKSEAVRQLERAGRLAGLNYDEVKGTVSSGLEYGMMNPRKCKSHS